MTRAGDHSAEVWRRQRWVACGLAGPREAATNPFGAVRDAVGRLGCVQAQEFDMTLWSLAQRTGCTRDDALDVLTSGEVLRTHALRVTWHFLRRSDLARVQVATADRVHKVLDPMLRVRDIDESTLIAWRARLEELLAAGPLTRAEIVARLAGTAFAFDGMTLGLVLMWAELEQVIASGPPRGVTHTYGLVDQPRPSAGRDESISWLVGQFLASHGPSSVPALCGWSSLTVTSVRRALADLGHRVHSEEILGTERHWIGPLADGSWPPAPTVALLNGYDEYVSGLDARSKMLLDPDRLYQGRTGTPNGLLMVDGKLAGHWRRIRSAKQVRLEVASLRWVTPPELAGLQRQAEDYAKFAGLPVDLDLLPVS